MPRIVRVQQARSLRARRRIEPPPSALYPVLRRASRAALRAERVHDAEISITLMDDAAITGMNARFLGHDAPTDVIAFALFDEGEPPVGDIYVGFDQVLRHAAAADTAIVEEFARVAIHGTLHVLGWEHPADASRLDSPMWRRQEEILAEIVPGDSGPARLA
jgi:probable rRNA maturation factor